MRKWFLDFYYEYVSGPVRSVVYLDFTVAKHCPSCNREFYCAGPRALPLVNRFMRCDECGARVRDMSADELYNMLVH